ncbi:protein fuzzy homolog isoform X2 [Pezoporus occidentalis]|uniref:protein fuzzy homolog isoform X2 n=1 Tax=Pezoporus occidentalis TaxID=407982 RepID=UPI002F9084FE
MAEGGGATLLLCLAAGSGLPLFCRPPRPQPPFPLIGALNGVHMFGAGAGVGLRRAETPGTRLQWGGDGSSITLIAISSAPDASGPALKRLLDSAFGAMVLVLGLDELVPIRNVERLKRDLRSCFVLLDALLSPGGGLGLGPPSWPLPPGPTRDLLQDTLDAFAAAAGTRWGCLVGAGRVRASTRRWGALPSAERALLAALLLPRGAGTGGEATPTAAARDLPVYLPQSSPTVPHRLLVLGLVGGVAVALLCGPRPPLQHVITQVSARSPPAGLDPERRQPRGGAGRGPAPPAPWGRPPAPLCTDGPQVLPRGGGTPPRAHPHAVLHVAADPHGAGGCGAGGGAGAAAAPPHPTAAPAPTGPQLPARPHPRLRPTSVSCDPQLGPTSVSLTHIWDTQLGPTSVSLTHIWDTQLGPTSVSLTHIWDTQLGPTSVSLTHNCGPQV